MTNSLGHQEVDTPNSLVPLSERHFIFTNSQNFNRRIYPSGLATAETFLRLPGGSVRSWKTDKSEMFFKETDATVRTLARWIAFANGIAKDPNSDLIAVASSADRHVKIFRLSKDASEMTLLDTVPLKFHVDNLSWENGVLLAAGHREFCFSFRSCFRLIHFEQPTSLH